MIFYYFHYFFKLCAMAFSVALSDHVDQDGAPYPVMATKLCQTLKKQDPQLWWSLQKNSPCEESVVVVGSAVSFAFFLFILPFCFTKKNFSNLFYYFLYIFLLLKFFFSIKKMN